MTTTPGTLEQFIAALQENTAATAKNNELLERVIAGQNAAIEKIEAPKATRKKADPATETPAAAAAAEPTTETPAAAAEPTAEVTDDEVKAEALAWMADVDPAGAADPAKKDVAKRTACADFFKAIVTHFGLNGTLTGPKAELNAEQRKQALFYLRRRRAGLSVDFNADYDFDGDPAQGGGASDTSADDEI